MVKISSKLYVISSFQLLVVKKKLFIIPADWANTVISFDMIVLFLFQQKARSLKIMKLSYNYYEV